MFKTKFQKICKKILAAITFPFDSIAVLWDESKEVER